MKIMYAKQLLLWPRFHASVIATLSQHEPDLIEFRQPMTESMTTVQNAILSVMRACLEELKTTNRIDVTELTVEKGLFASFDRWIRNQLDAVWHQTGFKTKQIVSDLGILRRL